MARVTLTPTALTAAGIADPAGTASVAGAGNGFTLPSQGSSVVFLRVANASGGSGTVSLLAGAGTAAISAGQGPILITVANSGTQWVGPFESARHAQADGSYAIETSVIMTVTAFIIDGRRSA
ncbi:hypothetical protein [Subtercola endophyticus]|uniref:hypothetical protein n=1 Tax=Subtercola endophyticus TaxID=2895559 RepID=UPI001E458038|nr:hypothetical protein [Subtercola endophyticus]UFS59478.1 hypothetical protein LQ955_01365 [Subtercola endophyticus]